MSGRDLPRGLKSPRATGEEAEGRIHVVSLTCDLVPGILKLGFGAWDLEFGIFLRTLETLPGVHRWVSARQ